MSVATSPPPGAGTPAATPPAPAREACPLCGAPLLQEQEWCLRCGAAARTRLAASPNWKGPLATLAVVVALSLGVLAAALVKLAGGSTAAATTTTVTTTSPAAVTPTQTTTARGSIVPGTSTSRTTTPGAAVHRTATSPGVAGATGLLHLTSPRAGKSKKRSFGLGRAVEERLRKVGLLPGAGTK